jgi:hypothetical protein
MGVAEAIRDGRLNAMCATVATMFALETGRRGHHQPTKWTRASLRYRVMRVTIGLAWLAAKH